MRADPVTLAELKGLPPEVGRELRGPNGKIDRVEMVRYALDHWDKLDDLDFKTRTASSCTTAVRKSRDRKHALATRSSTSRSLPTRTSRRGRSTTLLS
ncbi:hypothetical protein OHB36_26785 [Streptomyces sp. NBC_00320]|uniref:hypothetical protein n=1 Tax=unclassified Streptomyces TaxID=2593676 RepID=UPI00224CFF52|nr:hypothetical protein [Streptomyces sp. NBC_00320]MCX5150335.1 hypothetical protein [Streptomyces sp. NBC_00320]